MESNDKNLYELTFWISPDLQDDEVKNYFKKIENYIKDFNGEIKKEIYPFRKKMAYKINRKNYGFLSTFYFYLNPSDIIELKKKLKSESNILRFLIIKVTKHHLKLIEEPTISPKTRMKPQTPEKIQIPEKSESKIKLEELDKKLEEILGQGI